MSGRMTQRTRNLTAIAAASASVLIAVCVLHTMMLGQTDTPVDDTPPVRLIPPMTGHSQPRDQPPERREPPHSDAPGPIEIQPTQRPEKRGITISADFSQEWTDGALSVAILRGRCRVEHAGTKLTADTMVVWRRTEGNVFGTNRDRLLVYLERNAQIEQPGSTVRDTYLLWELATSDGVNSSVRHRLTDRPGNDDPVYKRAVERRQKSLGEERGVQPTQLVVPQHTEDLGPQLLTMQRQNRLAGVRKVNIVSRSAIPFSVRSFESKGTPPEQVWVLTGGINMVIDAGGSIGLVDLSADRMVIWTQTVEGADFQSNTVQSEDTPFEVYLEGNIVVRQGLNVIRASRATYDARENRALILDAELRAFVPALKDTVRVRAERIRQLSRNNYHAQNAWSTTSKFGYPGYRMQSSDIFLENRTTDTIFGRQKFDPETGQPVPSEATWMTSLNNTLFVENVPVFYLPYISAPAEDPNIPLRNLTLGSDRIFGFQIKTTWDIFGLFGRETPKGVRWNLLADYLTDRGPALGTSGDYKGRDLFGIPSVYQGEGLAYGILDDGRDNLGSDRRSLIPEDDFRYRMQLRHRHELPSGVVVLGELGLLSDRNFLEQYYEREFDRDKDVETLLYARQHLDNWAWEALGRPQVNDFETTTEWLPRGDLYVLSEPLFGSLVSWSSHTSAGYGKLRVGDTPSDPTDLYMPLPFVANASGAVLMSRHELNAPFNLGPVKVVPFAMGEGAFWSEGLNGEQDIDRFVGSAGIRSSLMFWRVFPQVYSELLNLNGLAHKSLIEVEYAFTDSTRDLQFVPQYNEFDENAQERFRTRLLTNTFGGVLPPQFEPRMYAVRTGAGRFVSSPYHELVDDQQVVRLAWRHRLQTKVGPAERLRIKDWMTLDLEASLFPNADRDNFGEDFGLLGGFYRWNFSDQTSFLASAQYDLFNDAQQVWNVGFLTGRSSRGSMYVGVRQIKGANLDSQILSASMSYKMSPKWISTFGTAYDLRENRNAGQSLTITRVGADFLFHIGANFDAGKNNAGISFVIEPRLGAFKSRLTQLGALAQGPLGPQQSP